MAFVYRILEIRILTFPVSKMLIQVIISALLQRSVNLENQLIYPGPL